MIVRPVPEFVWQEFWDSERINDRGIAIDRQLVRNAIRLNEAATQELTETLEKLTGLQNPNSVSQLRWWLQEQGLTVDSLGKKEVEKLLGRVRVHPGEVYYIPSGTVHAIGGGLRLMEVQQSCDITYRLYDWGRPRELHVQKGVASVKHEGLAKIARFPGRFECQYFSLEEIAVAGEARFKNESQADKNPAAVQLVYVLEGEGSVEANGSQAQDFAAEDIFALAPGEEAVFKSQKARVLKISAN